MLLMRLLLSLSCLLIAGLSLPMILGKVAPNSTYGFRTPLTLSRPDIWYAANTFSGWTLLIAAVISVVALWLLPARSFERPWLALAIFVVPLLISLAVSLIYLHRFR